MDTGSKIIKGITCEVNTCEYHTQDNQCSAGNIKVTHYGADTKEQTDCSTFKKKL